MGDEQPIAGLGEVQVGGWLFVFRARGASTIMHTERNRQDPAGWVKRRLGSPAALLPLLAALLIVLSTAANCAPRKLSYCEPFVQEYEADIEFVGSNTFQVQEWAMLTVAGKGRVFVALPPRPVAGENVEPPFAQVHIVPLQGFYETGRLELPDGTVLSGPLCTLPRPEAMAITVREMPRNSFYQAEYPEDPVEIKRYGGKETLTWSVRDLDRGITFSYLPKPYYHFRTFISLLAGLSSWGWLLPLAVTGLFVVSYTTRRRAPVEPESGRSYDLGRLRRILEEHFNREELRALCSDLDIEHENLPDTLTGLSMGLVKACEDRDMVAELVKIGRLERPSVMWDEVLEPETPPWRKPIARFPAWLKVLLSIGVILVLIWAVAVFGPGRSLVMKALITAPTPVSP